MLKKLHDESRDVSIPKHWLKLLYVAEWVAISFLATTGVWLLSVALSH